MNTDFVLYIEKRVKIWYTKQKRRKQCDGWGNVWYMASKTGCQV